MRFFQQAPKGAAATPLADTDVLLADLDGVVYRGTGAVAGAVDALNVCAARGIRVGYITNNASRTDVTVATHLRELGLGAAPEDIVTSPQAAAHILTEHVRPGALVLVVGGDGLVDELGKAGYRVTRSAEDAPDAVVQGFAPEVGWKELAEASFALARDIPWVATNQDWTIPYARGLAPGNGTLVSAVHTAVQKLPLVAGKPERALFDTAVERFAANNPLMVGDRLDTDIRGANRAGIRAALVLTGVDGPKQLFAAGPEDRPAFIIENLAELDAPYPEVEVTARPEYVEASVGTSRSERARVALDGIDLRVLAAGDGRLNLLRAACAAIWNSDKLIYALRIPEPLTREWSQW